MDYNNAEIMIMVDEYAKTRTRHWLWVIAMVVLPFFPIFMHQNERGTIEAWVITILIIVGWVLDVRKNRLKRRKLREKIMQDFHGEK